MRLYNTLTRQVEELVPRDPGRVGLYVCGPTVQGPPHFGHARAAIVPDVLRRYLEWSGLEVFHVRNITDVEDKIIATAESESRPAAAVAEHYSRVWDDQISQLGVLAPHVVPRASGHIMEMIELIERLVQRGAAYEAGGDVYFAVRAFEEYGKLSGRRPDELRAGARVETDERKRDPLDFALWKAAKPGEPDWPSPWGRGRPGWHIECSAMAVKYLGEGFDIHAGGVDLVFPHHENEIAQFEAATGRPFARLWMHNGMLNLGTQKMSKSVGNIISLGEALHRYGGEVLRLFYLRADYRSPVEFSEERLDEAAAAFDRLTAFLRATSSLGVAPTTVAQAVGNGPPTGIDDEAVEGRQAFAAAMEDDLATPRAHAVLFDLVSTGNQHLEAGRHGRAGAVGNTVRELAGVLGYTFEAVDRGGAGLVGPLVEELLAVRDDARRRRDFVTADRIRARLGELGVVVEDSADGARWHLGRPV